MRLLASLCLIVAFAATADQASAAVPCGPTKHARTLRATDEVRVYIVRGRFVSACARGTKRTVALGDSFASDYDETYRVLHIRIRGAYVAWVRTCFGCRDYNSIGLPHLQVWDVRAHRQIYDRSPTSTAFGPAITDVELGADGTVGYLVARDVELRNFEVHRGNDVLDTGPIGARSLTLGGDDRLYWRRDGALQSAPLHPVASG